MIPDELPQISVRLAGIGAAITPNAIVPLVGKVTDDYGLDSHLVCLPGERRSRQDACSPISRTANRNKLRSARSTLAARPCHGRAGFGTEPGQTLFLSVRASGPLQPQHGPREGASQQFALDVVTMPQLLALWSGATGAAAAVRIGVRQNDRHPKLAEPRRIRRAGRVAGRHRRALTRRRLRVAGALQNVTQSSHEVLGLAEAFDDMHEQLVNNRVDNVDLKSRFRNKLPSRCVNWARVDVAIRVPAARPTIGRRPEAGAAAVADSMRLSDGVLVEMQQILDRMLELESYNEVVGFLRGIIQDQEKLDQRTKEQQSERIKDLLDE